MDLILEYRRSKGALSTGRLLFRADREAVVTTFEDLEFPRMLRLVADSLDSVESLYFQRTDRPGIPPFRVDSRVVRLLREDFDGALAALSPRVSSPSSVLKKREEGQAPVRGIRAGFDTLADAFGETVFAACRSDRGAPVLECPRCGMWSRFEGTEATLWTCSKACARAPSNSPLSATPLIFAGTPGRWVGFLVEELLATKSSRFYLPRSWNPKKSWISREELEHLLSQYKKESRL